MKTPIKHFLISVIYLFLSLQNISAQFFSYSQFEHTPLNINPAIISNENNTKLSILYHQNELLKELKMRNFQMSLIYPLNLIKTERSLQGIGVSMEYDNTGKQGLASCTNGSFAFAQGVTINKWSSLSAGLQASFFFYRNNYDTYTTGNQWIEGTGFDPSIGINENININNVNLFTINTGINWHINNGDISRGMLGVSVYNLNKPAYTLLDKKDRLEPKTIVHGNYTVFSKKNISISPRILFIFQDINLISLGTLVNYSVSTENPFSLIQDCNLQLGLDYRHNHSGIVNFAFEQPKYILGISYAFALNSKKVNSNYNSNFEVCVVIKLNRNKKQTQSTSTYNIGETRLVFNKEVNKNVPDENKKYDNYNLDTITVAGENYRLQLREYFKFKFNEATLPEEAQTYLDEMAKMLRQNPSLRIEVIGHTDDVGTEEANLKISEQRAQTVIEYFISKGIKPTRLKHTAKGKSEPIVPNTSEENRSKNRRVEFIIYSE